MKTVSSILAGLFAILLGGGFILGSTNLSEVFGPAKTTIAEIGKENIPFHQFLKFRHYLRYQKKSDPNMKEDSLRFETMEVLIRLYLMKKLMYEWGYQPTDNELRDFQVALFKNEKGKFDKNNLLQFRRNFNFNDRDFELLLIERNFFEKLDELAMASKEEARFDLIAENSAFKIEYIFIRNSDLDKRFEKSIQISEDEIKKELAKENKNLTAADPKKQKNEIIKKIKTAQKEAQKRKLLTMIQEISKKNASLTNISKFSGMPLYQSIPFKPGEQIYSAGKNKTIAAGLSDAQDFITSLSQKPLKTVFGPISTNYGTYYYTIMNRSFPNLEKKYPNLDRELEKRVALLKNERKRVLFQEIFESYRNKLKIVRHDSKFFKNEEQ